MEVIAVGDGLLGECSDYGLGFGLIAAVGEGREAGLFCGGEVKMLSGKYCEAA